MYSILWFCYLWTCACLTWTQITNLCVELNGIVRMESFAVWAQSTQSCSYHLQSERIIDAIWTMETCDCWFTHAQTHFLIYPDWENNTDRKRNPSTEPKTFSISNSVLFDVQIKMRTVDICTNSFRRPPKALAHNLTLFYLRCGANTKIDTMGKNPDGDKSVIC